MSDFLLAQALLMSTVRLKIFWLHFSVRAEIARAGYDIGNLFYFFVFLFGSFARTMFTSS